MFRFSCFAPSALLVSSFILGASVGCGVGVKGSGVVKSELREVADFKSISSDIVGEVLVKMGESQSVEVTFDDNLLPMVSTEAVDGELRISTTGSFSTSVGLKINITTPSLDSVRSSGVGAVKIEGLNAETFSIALSGVGGISAKGEVKSLDVTVSGVGSADLDGLVAEEVSVTVSGVGGAKVHASKSVNASTTGVGSIRVSGNPSEKKESKSGVGSIKFE